MNKNKMLLAITLGTSVLSSCGYNDKSNNPVKYSEIYEEKTTTKVFSPGTHIIEYSDVQMVGMSETYEGYIDLNIEVPEGYELVDYEISDRKLGPSDQYYNRGFYIFVNTDEVEATGVYDKDKDEYFFSNPGKVVKKDKKVKTRKK